ncbi:MAG TPA: glucokinase [Acidobacteriota bacterium]|jgi:glucokinase
MILAGDIGGTKVNLGFFDQHGAELKLLAATTFSAHRYSCLEDVVRDFVSQPRRPVTHACFAVAGPVREGRSHTTNLPWEIDSGSLKEVLQLPKVDLINDLEATAYGIALLGPESLLCLNPGKQVPGNRVVIAAGTGLGEGTLYWNGNEHVPSPSEGGHTEFGPRNDLEIELLHYLLKKFDHVSYERVVSGPGLRTIYEFLRDTGQGKEPSWLAEEMEDGDVTASVSRAALEGKSQLAVDALDLFASIYGAEAGNLALKCLALGGVYVGGGIAPKIQKKLIDGSFMNAFADKGRFRELMQTIPVQVILDEKTALKGAARRAVL